MDVLIAIPTRNTQILEHFCYKYLGKKQPEEVLKDELQISVAKLYDVYFMSLEYEDVKRRQTFLCTMCSHNENMGPCPKMICTIPEDFLEESYNKAGVTRVSTFTTDIIHYFHTQPVP